MMLGPRTHHRTCPCGWEGLYNTPGYADKAHRLHDCATDHTPRSCPIDHPHGLAAHYQHCGCRCWPCRLAALESIERSHKNRAYGRGRYVDAAPVRTHLRQLMDAGMGWPRIAELSSVEATTLCRVIWGKVRDGRREYAQRIHRDTAATLLALTYDPADGGPTVDGDATTRRLRALLALGWWPSEIARQSGWEIAYVQRLIAADTPKCQRVRPGTARRVHALFRRLAELPPPSGPYAARARRRAAVNNWGAPIRIGGRVIAGLALEDAARLDDQEVA